MTWQDFIEVRPGVAQGKPVFKGTRLTVEFVLERLSDGATIEDLVQNYVGLTPDHVRAAAAYAASLLRRDEVVWST
ncbi:MAG: DUF433 domain-containing protein [Phycisphaerae bacterium]